MPTLARMSRFAVVGATVLVAACQAAPSTDPASAFTSAPAAIATASPPRSAQASPDASARELPASGQLDPGPYTRIAFQPPIAFTLDEGWSVGSLATGFFDVQQQQGTPDVIAVQFANVEAVIGQDGKQVATTTAREAAAAMAQNPGLTVLGESGSQIGGLAGFTIEVENATGAHVGILDVPPGRLGIDPARRLWISLFDADNGVLAVMVGGSTDDWDHALLTAEPVLESIAIG
jgi:hypothetical protein